MCAVVMLRHLEQHELGRRDRVGLVRVGYLVDRLGHRVLGGRAAVCRNESRCSGEPVAVGMINNTALQLYSAITGMQSPARSWSDQRIRPSTYSGSQFARCSKSQSAEAATSAGTENFA